MSTIRTGAHSTPARPPATAGRPHGTPADAAAAAASPFASTRGYSPAGRAHASPSVGGSGPSSSVGLSKSLRRNVHAVSGSGSPPPSFASRPDGQSTESLALLPVPDAEMSCHAQLASHLDDYVALVDQLFDSFDPTALAAQTHAAAAGHVAASSTAAAAAAATLAAASTDALMTRLIRKDQLLQSSVCALLAHQSLHRSLQAKWAEVARLDREIVGFCQTLGRLEHDLLECSTDGALETAGLVKGLGGQANPQQAFRAREVTIFAQKLARMSFAPADHLERKAVLHADVTRPPAPLEKLMAGSLLHLTPGEMQQLLDAEEQARREADEAKKAGAAAMLEEAMPHMPGSLAALGRQDSAPSTGVGLPSFAELAQGGGAAREPAQMWPQQGAQRTMATAPPVALDLDLESSDSESDDD